MLSIKPVFKRCFKASSKSSSITNVSSLGFSSCLTHGISFLSSGKATFKSSCTSTFLNLWKLCLSELSIGSGEGIFRKRGTTSTVPVLWLVILAVGLLNETSKLGTSGS